MPLTKQNNVNFSFSGLKTAVSRTIDKVSLSNDIKADIAASFQNTVCKTVDIKIRNAIQIYLQKYSNKCLAISGGVAANGAIRKVMSKIAKEYGFSLHYPPIYLCTDNAAMIAWAAIEKLQRGASDSLSFPHR